MKPSQPTNTVTKDRLEPGKGCFLILDISSCQKEKLCCGNLRLSLKFVFF